VLSGLRDPRTRRRHFRFVASTVTRATREDTKLLRMFLNDDDLREALDHTPSMPNRQIG